MTYYDLHSHILPELDDGSKSVEMSLEIIEKLRKQGVTNLCFTPHYYSNEESIEAFLEKRQKSVEKLMPHIPKDVKVCIGAEVYITRYIFNNKDLSGLCYGNSKYILCEFGFNSRFSDHTMEHIYRLQSNYGLSPVLTHIERYDNLMKNKYLVEQLLDEDVLIQTNVSALMNKADRRKLLKYIKNDYIDVVGTDCHSLTRGNPDEYTPAMELIAKKCGQEYVDKIIDTSKMIFDEATK